MAVVTLVTSLLVTFVGLALGPLEDCGLESAFPDLLGLAQFRQPRLLKWRPRSISRIGKIFFGAKTTAKSNIRWINNVFSSETKLDGTRFELVLFPMSNYRRLSRPIIRYFSHIGKRTTGVRVELDHLRSEQLIRSLLVFFRPVYFSTM